MAASKTSMLGITLLMLAVVQTSRGEDPDSEIADAVNLISAMKGMTKALECFGGTMKESLSVQEENSNTFRDLLRESLDIHRRNSDSLTELGKCPKVDTGLMEENMDLKLQLADEKKKVANITEALGKSLLQLGEMSATERRFNNRVEELEKSLKDSQTLAMGLMIQIQLLNSTINSQQYTAIRPGCGSQDPRVKAQVDAYSRNKNWEGLRSKLIELLDSSSSVYRQIESVSDTYNSPLFEVARRGYTDLVKLLLCNGMPLGMAGTNRYSMLHGAAYGGQLETVNLLVQFGADIEAVDSDDDTPLINAARAGHLSVIQFLVKNGASTSYHGSLGRTAQEWAISGGHTDIVQFLSNL